MDHGVNLPLSPQPPSSVTNNDASTIPLHYNQFRSSTTRRNSTQGRECYSNYYYFFIILIVFCGSGVVFLLFVRYLILRQPFLMKGISVRNAPVVAQVAYDAAMLYVFVSCVLLLGVYMCRYGCDGRNGWIRWKYGCYRAKRYCRLSRLSRWWFFGGLKKGEGMALYSSDPKKMDHDPNNGNECSSMDDDRGNHHPVSNYGSFGMFARRRRGTRGNKQQ